MIIYKRCSNCGNTIRMNIKFDRERGWIFFDSGKFYCSEECAIKGESVLVDKSLAELGTNVRCEECNCELEVEVLPTNDKFVCKKCGGIETQSRVESLKLYEKLKELKLCEICAKLEGWI